jgi:hypothetical protein
MLTANSNPASWRAGRMDPSRRVTWNEGHLGSGVSLKPWSFMYGIDPCATHSNSKLESSRLVVFAVRPISQLRNSDVDSVGLSSRDGSASKAVVSSRVAKPNLRHVSARQIVALTA